MYSVFLENVSEKFGSNGLNVKVYVGAFNQEKAIIGALFVIVQLRRLIVCSSSHKSVCSLRGLWSSAHSRAQLRS